MDAAVCCQAFQRDPGNHPVFALAHQKNPGRFLPHLQYSLHCLWNFSCPLSSPLSTVSNSNCVPHAADSIVAKSAHYCDINRKLPVSERINRAFFRSHVKKMAKTRNRLTIAIYATMISRLDRLPESSIRSRFVFCSGRYYCFRPIPASLTSAWQ